MREGGREERCSHMTSISSVHILHVYTYSCSVAIRVGIEVPPSDVILRTG